MAGRPRVAAWSHKRHHGRLYLVMRTLDGRRLECRVPDGWDEAATFCAWLRDYVAAHPVDQLPPIWRPYLTAARTAPTWPTRYTPSPAQRTARAAQLRDLYGLPPGAVVPRPWDDAVAAYGAALRQGWRCPRKRTPRRPDWFKTDLATLLRLAHGPRPNPRRPPRLPFAGMNWTSTADLTRANVHALIQALEAAAYANGSLCAELGRLRSFAVWCEQQSPPLCAPVIATWPTYARAHRKRESRTLLGHLDQLAALAPRWLKPPPDGTPLRAIVLLMRWLYLRHMGICRLARCDFHLDADPPYLDVDPRTDKTSLGRRLPLPPPLVAELRAVFADAAYAPADLPFGRRRADGSISKRPTIRTWNQWCDRAGVPLNLDGTRGFHRCRKAGFEACMEAPVPDGATLAGAYATKRDLLGVTSEDIDTYVHRRSLRQLAAAQSGAPRVAAPVQLAFTWRGTYVEAAAHDADGVRQVARFAVDGEFNQGTLLKLVWPHVRAVARDERGAQPEHAAPGVPIPGQCRASASSPLPPPSTAGIPRSPSPSGARRTTRRSLRSTPRANFSSR